MCCTLICICTHRVELMQWVRLFLTRDQNTYSENAMVIYQPLDYICRITSKYFSSQIETAGNFLTQILIQVTDLCKWKKFQQHTMIFVVTFLWFLLVRSPGTKVTKNSGVLSSYLLSLWESPRFVKSSDLKSPVLNIKLRGPWGTHLRNCKYYMCYKWGSSLFSESTF